MSECRNAGRNLTNSEAILSSKGLATGDAKKRKIDVVSVSGTASGKAAAVNKGKKAKSVKPIKPPTRTLYNLINKQEFGEARRRIVSHPADALYIGPDGKPTALHLCVGDHKHPAAPTDLFATILEANPSALFRKTVVKKKGLTCGGRTPLHSAASGGLAAHVELLLDRCPPRQAWLSETLRIPDGVASSVLSFLPPNPALTKDDHANTPLHLAASGATFDPDVVDVVAALVSRYPETGTMTSDSDVRGRQIVGFTPLHEVVSNCPYRRHERTLDLLRVLIKHARSALRMSCGDSDDWGHEGTPMRIALSRKHNGTFPREVSAIITSETMKLEKEDLFHMLTEAYRKS